MNIKLSQIPGTTLSHLITTFRVNFMQITINISNCQLWNEHETANTRWVAGLHRRHIEVSKVKDTLHYNWQFWTCLVQRESYSNIKHREKKDTNTSRTLFLYHGQSLICYIFLRFYNENKFKIIEPLWWTFILMHCLLWPASIALKQKNSG